MTFYAGLMSLVGRYEVATERKERRELQASTRAAHLANGNMPKHQLTVSFIPCRFAPTSSTFQRQHSKFHDNTKHALVC